MKFYNIFGLITIFSGIVLAIPISKIPDSDLTEGELGLNDVLEYSYTNVTSPPGQEYSDWFFRAFANFTYITVVEDGDHPDARASTIRGGVGFTRATIRLLPGLSGNYNYTIELWSDAEK